MHACKFTAGIKAAHRLKTQMSSLSFTALLCISTLDVLRSQRMEDVRCCTILCGGKKKEKTKGHWTYRNNLFFTCACTHTFLLLTPPVKRYLRRKLNWGVWPSMTRGKRHQFLLKHEPSIPKLPLIHAPSLSACLCLSPAGAANQIWLYFGSYFSPVFLRIYSNPYTSQYKKSSCFRPLGLFKQRLESWSNVMVKCIKR